eukprot:3248827-Amphidinium_carterae.1
MSSVKASILRSCYELFMEAAANSGLDFERLDSSKTYMCRPQRVHRGSVCSKKREAWLLTCTVPTYIIPYLEELMHEVLGQEPVHQVYW